MKRILQIVCGITSILLAQNQRCLGIVGNINIDDTHYQTLAEQTPFAGTAKVIVGAGCCGSTGSGVLLNDEWLVTAAHVVHQKDVSSLSIQWGGQSRAVSAVHFTDEWIGSPTTGLDQGGDLALVHLAQSFNFKKSTPIASGAFYSSGGLDNRLSVMVGMGKGGNGVLGAFDTSMPRAATNTIDRQIQTSGAGGLLVTDFDNGTSPQNALNADTVSWKYYDDGFDGLFPSDVLFDPNDQASLMDSTGSSLASYFPEIQDLWYEGTTASGDSGGGLFVFDDVTAEWQLAGITSWGFNPTLPEGFSRYDSRYGDVAFFTDLSQHSDWIAATVPEPSVGVLLGLGILFGSVFYRQPH